MSLHASPGWLIPEETVRVACAAFPKGNRCMQMHDALGPIYRDGQFAGLFSQTGQPAEAPARLALVLVFAVTRVILIPQGEFVTFGALSYAMLCTGNVPGTAWLALAMGIVALALDLFAARRARHLKKIGRSLALNVAFPAAIVAATYLLVGRGTPIAINIVLALLTVAAISLYLYRLAFQPLAHTSVLVLLIASVGCHLALQGLGLVFVDVHFVSPIAVRKVPSPGLLRNPTSPPKGEVVMGHSNCPRATSPWGERSPRSGG